MMGIQTAGLLGESTTSFPIAGIGEDDAHVGKRKSVHGIQYERPFGHTLEGLAVAPEKHNRGQSVIAVMIGGRNLDGALRRRERPLQRLGQEVVSLRVLFAIKDGKDGP